MSLIDFSNIFILLIWIAIFAVFNIIGLVKKSSWHNFITLIFSITFLILHIIFRNVNDIALYQSILVDFISMIFSIFLYLYVDDIESRRKVISEVFENKYKK